MSNNPFQTPAYGPQGQQFQPQPQPQKKKTNVVLWVLIILGIIGVLGCGCCGGIWYFGVGALSTTVQSGYENNDVVIDKLGSIDSIAVNLQVTGENDGEMVFDVKGSKGKGQIFVRDQSGTSFGGARLKFKGEFFELGPSQ